MGTVPRKYKISKELNRNGKDDKNKTKNKGRV